MLPGSGFFGSPLLRWAHHVFEVGMMLFSYFWLSCCSQNDTPKATNFLAEAVMVRSRFSDLVHTILPAASQRKKKRCSPPSPVGVFTSSGSHISSLWGMVLCWQMLSAALPPPSPLSVVTRPSTDEDSVAFMGPRTGRSAEPPQLKSTPWKTLLSCNSPQSLEEFFSLLATDLVLDFALACRVGSVFIIWVFTSEVS